jgi:LEA14-like dessication related protein
MRNPVRVLPHLALALLLASGCAKPKPPSITPRSVQLSAIKPDGVQLSLILAAHNPNAFPLVVSSVSGNFELQDGTPLGNAQSSLPLSIPAEGDQDLSATLDIRFSSASALAPYALTGRPLPYRVRGTASVGSEKLNVDVPFTIDGELTREQLLAAGLRGAADLLNPPAPSR